MKFKLDIDELEALEKLLREVSDSVDEFETAFTNIIDELADETSADVITQVIKISRETLPEVNKLAAGFEAQADIAKDYLEGVREINEETASGYELDTSETKGYIKDTKR